MKASEIMTKRLISIEPEATIVQAIKLMLKNHLSGLLVIDRPGKLVGIITEGDFLHRREIGTELKRNAWLDAIFGPEQSAHDYVRAHGARVAELMTRPPITVDADTSLDKVVHLMERHHIKRLPVLRKGKVVGIISRANLMRALASIDRASSKTSRNDQEIRKRIEFHSVGRQFGFVIGCIVTQTRMQHDRPWQHAVQPLHGTTLIGKVDSFGSITRLSSAAGAKQQNWPT